MLTSSKLKSERIKILFFILIAFFFTTPSTTIAQVINNQTNVVFLKENATLLQQKLDNNRQIAFAIAKEKGWETFTIKKDGTVTALQGIDELGLPIYFTTYNNSIAAATTNTNKLYNGGGLGLSLSGSTIGNGKVAIWDGGAVLLSHIELINRVLTKDNAKTLSTHSTHVAGTIMATGINQVAKGMSFGLPQLLSFEFNNDISEMSASATDLLISNHSYGTVSGWRFNDDVTPARWEFMGAPDENEDYKFGYYNSAAKEWDKICYNAPYYLPVKSAGNNRNDNGPAVGLPYFRYNSSGVMASAGNRPTGISSNNGYDIISTYGNAKNILTVGAINPLPFGPTSTASIQISSFSSWGPTDDGRIKPDIVADGVNVTSTSDANNSAYTTYSGTSMSAPNVSGSLVLLQELFSQKNNGAFMRSATLKGLAIATATEAGSNPGPDYIYGWGLLNMESAANAILNKGNKSIINESSISQGTTQTINVIASGNGPLIATICWTDPEANSVSTALALNNPTPRLVNDLDLRISQNNTSYSPWILNPAVPGAAATTGDNVRDNVEQVYIANAIPGKTYTITVSHKGNLERGPQAFSIIVTGVGGAGYCVSSPISNADSKISNFKLSNVDFTSTLNSCTSYTNNTNQTIELEKGGTYPLSLNLGTCGANFNKIAKVFIDWNGDNDFDDENELVATTNVINTTGTYNTTIKVPTQVTVNNFSLLRIVLTETNNAADVVACGAFQKGETQEYRVKFTNSSIDVAVTSILNPVGTICANTTQTVSARIKNMGTQSVSNIPITAIISENSTVVATLNANFTGSLSYLNEADIIFPSSFNAQAGKTYTITTKTMLSGDILTANDQIIGTTTISMPPIVTSGEIYACDSTNTFSLNTIAQNTVFWYKNNNDLTPIAFGNTTSTIVKPENNSFYVGINDFKANIGPKNKSDIGDGGYNQFGPGISINTLIPITIESAKLYIGNSGQIRFTVVNSSGVAVSSSLLNVTATRTISAVGAAVNDPLDLGQTYPLNLTIPSAGAFTINIEYLNGATIFRNNVNNTNYPYTTDLNLFSIGGNTAVLNGNPDYFKSFYYYLYDIKVKAGGCLGASRLAIPISTAKITESEGILSSNFTTNNQWYLNGKAIIGATNQQFTPKENGFYTVEISKPNGCSLKSESITFLGIDKKLPGNEINLKTFPIPTNSDLNIYFEVLQKSNFSISINNLLGKTVFVENKLNYNGIYINKINLSNYQPGIYVLKVKVANKDYVRKIILVK